jgi:hypothetical protein
MGFLYKKVLKEFCSSSHTISMSAFFVKSIETKVEELELVEGWPSTISFEKFSLRTKWILKK